MSKAFEIPKPKTPIQSEKLTRPDWTQTESRDPNILFLDKNENIDPVLRGVVHEMLANLPSEAVHSYPEPGSLYLKLAAHTDLTAAHVIVAAGSDGIIRAAYECFVGEGDKVLHAMPTFAMYPVNCMMFGAVPVRIEYLRGQAGPVLNIDSMIAAVHDERPKLVCLANPDSPTGSIVARDQLRTLIEAAATYGIPVLIDEAYYPFLDETAADWVDEFPNLIVARSTGKAWGLAGFRIGYGIAQPGLATLLNKVRPMYETNTIAMLMLERMIDRYEDVLASVARIKVGKQYFIDAMTCHGFQTIAGYGNFAHVAFGDAADDIHTGLADLVYYRQNFKEPCLADFSRFSMAPVDIIRRVTDRIDQIMQGRTA